ncbi:Structural maintenance of chromosomes protein 4 [Dimargaris xerosporica]|nr:Structural maintenance of chromosomes protein 4 [Dimargaris xerosporica]
MLQMPAAPEPPATPQPVPSAGAATDQRLIITRMVLNNFKSYAGRQEIGPFHKSFSSVVGPNGSGKSNVIDALLFVFGYRANKMRQGKLSELIHNSQQYQNLDSCAVEVHFCEICDLPGDNQYDVIPNSELVICRVANRNNTSRYYINQRSSSFTEVTTLLRQKGVDLDHKRFLILQGEVESISQMKPKAQTEHEEGLLEYLEDIIGTSKYKEPISQAGHLLDGLNDERTEKLNRMKIAEREKNSLEGKKTEAEQYIRAENDMVVKRSTLFQRRLMDCQAKATRSESAYVELKQKLDSQLASFVEYKEELRTLEDNYKAAVKEYESMGKKANAITKELTKFEREDVQLQENYKYLKTKIKKLDKAIQKDGTKLSELESTMVHAETDIANGQQEYQEMELQLGQEEQALNEITEGLKGKTEVFSQQIEERQRELAPWIERINSQQSLLAIAQSDYKLLEEKTQAVSRQRTEMQAEIEDLENLKTLKQQQMASALAKVKDGKKKLRDLTQTVDATASQEQDFRRDIQRARQKLQDARSSYETLQSRGKVLQGLLRMKETGRIEGIHNRLGSLGVIDDQYDVAISNACPSLDSIVVDNVPSAQKCIEHLRKNNLGRGIFLVLNQLRAKPTPTPATPEGVPRLFDLVRPKDPQYNTVFYHVLGDTLVAQDLAQANRIAFGQSGRRWRVVTLQGQLIETRGTMSGGGNRVVRGLMSSKFVGDDITAESLKALEKQCHKQEQEWREFNKLRDEMKVEIQMLEKNLPGADTEASKLRMEIDGLTQQQDILQARIAALADNDQPDERDVAQMQALQRQICEHEQQLAQLHETKVSIEGAIKELQNKILEVGGVQLRVQKAKVESLKERLETCQGQLVKLDVAVKKATKDRTKVEQAIDKQRQERDDAQIQLTRLTGDIERKTAAALEVKERCDQVRDRMDDMKEGLDARKAELDQKTAEVNQIRTTELDLKHAAEEAERVHAENLKGCNYWTGELSRLSLQEVSGAEHTQGMTLETYAPDYLAEVDVTQLSSEIKQLEAQLERAKPNLSVLTEYQQRAKECEARSQDLDEVTLRRETAKQEYDNLRKKRLDEFMEGFNVITYKLKEMYQMITLGGNAELELVDSLDPFSEGIIFSVMPPKKSWRNIANLSGGEKTLSSLALVFALHHYKPTPLYVMDEIDAALDFRNVSIVANYIKDRTKDAQFVIISLRNNMFELADRLVGIYKTHNQTKSIAINPYAQRQVNQPPPSGA